MYIPNNTLHDEWLRQICRISQNVCWGDRAGVTEGVLGWKQAVFIWKAYWYIVVINISTEARRLSDVSQNQRQTSEKKTYYFWCHPEMVPSKWINNKFWWWWFSWSEIKQGVSSVFSLCGFVVFHTHAERLGCTFPGGRLWRWHVSVRPSHPPPTHTQQYLTSRFKYNCFSSPTVSFWPAAIPAQEKDI